MVVLLATKEEIDKELKPIIDKYIKKGEFRPKGEWVEIFAENIVTNKTMGKAIGCSKCYCPKPKVADNYCPFCGADMRGEE